MNAAVAPEATGKVSGVEQGSSLPHLEKQGVDLFVCKPDPPELRVNWVISEVAEELQCGGGWVSHAGGRHAARRRRGISGSIVIP